jgi:hypothetical protein
MLRAIESGPNDFKRVEEFNLHILRTIQDSELKIRRNVATNKNLKRERKQGRTDKATTSLLRKDGFTGFPHGVPGSE